MDFPSLKMNRDNLLSFFLKKERRLQSKPKSQKHRWVWITSGQTVSRELRTLYGVHWIGHSEKERKVARSEQ